MSNVASRLILGSANFGLDYGIANTTGRVLPEAVQEILITAHSGGVSAIDTARSYGESEDVLGKYDLQSFQIISKVGGLCHEPKKAPIVLAEQIKISLDALGVSSLYGLLIHEPNDLLGPDAPLIVEALLEAKSMGLVQKIGVSIYSPSVLSEINKVFRPEIVQAPFNIFDQRLEASGWASRLKDAGSEIHLRSAFLQGLLLVQKNQLPEKFTKNWPEAFEGWFLAQSRTQRSPTELALSYLFSKSWADKIVVGVDNPEQLCDLLSIEKADCFACDCLPSFDISDERLLDPFSWSSL